jgi:hypothetical protein
MEPPLAASAAQLVTAALKLNPRRDAVGQICWIRGNTRGHHTRAAHCLWISAHDQKARAYLPAVASLAGKAQNHV